MSDRVSQPDDRSSLAELLAKRVRSKLVAGITHLTSGGGGPSLDYSSPPGDPGLFGPDAVCWKGHADFTSMMAGGVRALLPPPLHPPPPAGVRAHSAFPTPTLGPPPPAP